MGPVDWDNVHDRERWGLDLRGAIVDSVDLSGLPLARLRGGLAGRDWDTSTDRERRAAGLSANGADFTYARLEGATFTYANLERGSFQNARLEDVDAYAANFGAADLKNCRFNSNSKLLRVRLADNMGMGPCIAGIRWGGADLTGIDWQGVRVLMDEERAWDARTSPGKADRYSRYLQGASTAYQRLSKTLYDQGMAGDAGRFAYRSHVVERQVMLRAGRWGSTLYHTS